MRKIILLVAVMFLFVPKVYAAPLTTEAYVTPEDVSITRMEYNRKAITDYCNSFPGDSIQDGSITTTQLDDNANPENRWDDSFNDYVFTGLLPPTTSGTLTSTTTAGRAYIEGVRVAKDATANTYTLSKWTYVDLSKTGTYTYSETVIGGGVPAVAANSIRLCRVSSDGTQVFAVRDDRITAISLGSNEDFYRSGLTISVTTPATIAIAPGICYNGSTRLSKTAATSLALGTAADWTTGVSARATSTYGYVVIDSSGNLKLTVTAPTTFDTSGNTAGTLRYSDIGSAYYRVLAWFYMNATGSGEITDSTSIGLQDGYGNFKDGDVSNKIKVVGDNDIDTSSATYVGINDMTAEVLTAGGPISVCFEAPFDIAGVNHVGFIALDIDGTNVLERYVSDSNGITCHPSLTWTQPLTAGEHTIKAEWKYSDTAPFSQDGATDGQRIMIIEEN